MRREDFKEIKDIHIKSAEAIVISEGACTVVNCDDCPFYWKNHVNSTMCISAGYSSNDTDKEDKDGQLLKSAKAFLNMIRTEKCTFSNAKVGDRVWNIHKGWGKIVEVDLDYACPLRVEFDKYDFSVSFTMDGKEYVNDINPTLFWDEIKFEIPEKPFDLESELRKLEIVEFNSGGHNFYLLWDYDYKQIKLHCDSVVELANYKYFSESSIRAFIERIKGKDITKEQFFRVYKNVFNEE